MEPLQLATGYDDPYRPAMDRLFLLTYIKQTVFESRGKVSRRGISNGGGKYYDREDNKQHVTEQRKAIMHDARRTIMYDKRFETMCDLADVDIARMRAQLMDWLKERRAA